MKTRGKLCSVLATVPLLISPCFADTPATISVILNTTSVIRSDISKATFGSSVEAFNPKFGWVMGKPTDGTMSPSDNTRQKISSFNLGAMRFPGGNPAQDYIWWNPQIGARPSDQNNPAAPWITQDEMLDYTSTPTIRPKGLGMERLYQVNTSNSLRWNAITNRYDLLYVNKNLFTNPSVPQIDWVAVENASISAADWVRDNKRKGLQDSTRWVNYWEVGNEDWIWWTGAQYGKIFQIFALRMIEAEHNIKLLVQGLSKDEKIVAENTVDTWIDGLKANIDGLPGRVYGYSDHEYLNGDVPWDPNQLDETRRKQTENMLAKVASGTRIDALKRKLAEDSRTAPWKIWVTEFNAEAKDVFKKPAVLSDMGHALVIADWTGKMLEQNVERMFLFSLDDNPAYAMIQYSQDGSPAKNGTLANPRVQPQGYAYSIYAKEFGETMISNTASIERSNPFLTPDNSSLPAYKQLAVYSSIKKGPPGTTGQDTLRVIAINRSQTNSVYLNLQTDGGPGARWMKGTPATGQANFSYRRLTSPHIYDSNKGLPIGAPDKIHWEPDLDSAPWTWPCYPTGINKAGLPPASVNLFVIPLQ